MVQWHTHLLRLILVVVGGIIIFIALNLAFGGIQTLGWQGTSDFVEITNELAYQTQDNHIRFLGGLFGGVGLFLILGASDLKKYQLGLKIVFALIFIGGLARLTQGQIDIIMSGNVIGSFIAEIALMPILFLWVSRSASTKQQA